MGTVLASLAGTPRDLRQRELQLRYQRVCELFEDRRVEIVDGEIVIREVPTLDHNQVIFQLLLQIMFFVDQQGWTACNDIKVFLGAQIDRYRPDITVVPANPRMWDAENVYAQETLLVVEVVSPSSRIDDHVVKPRNCAKAGVPLYLVIDTGERTARLLSHPGQTGYSHEVAVVLGDSLVLPDPWDLKIDTARFVS
ncbi:Uma2 family endonuclease [Sphaerisporangium fuscum]|uniref:Uma2 family endonuclease n=1 Tax=Sphaerisporangium fuscum TaxID=2835868 RepID=UPI001BDCB84F|nr:Uma2 family endonuclease [Sphaerisporangium fuscum]